MNSIASALASRFHKLSSGFNDREKIRGTVEACCNLSKGLFDRTLSPIPGDSCRTILKLQRESASGWLTLTIEDVFLTDFRLAFHGLTRKGLKKSFFFAAADF